MNATLSAPITLTPAYTSQAVTINAVPYTLTIPLSPGVNTYTSPLINVGALPYFSDPVLQAQIQVWYDYNPLSNALTLCGNDLVSDDSTCLITVARSTTQYCRQHTYLGDTQPCGANPNWTYCTPVTPGLLQLFQNTVRTANQTIIMAARAAGFTVIVRTPPPALSAADSRAASLVYRNGTFAGFFDPDTAYADGHKVVAPESAWYGEIYLSPNDRFANVIGSDGDRRIAGLTWIQLWRNQFDAPPACASYQFNNFACGGGGPLGGHVILGTVAQVVPTGANYVFIMPICVNHNNNDNVYMAPLMTQKGIALASYHNP